MGQAFVRRARLSGAYKAVFDTPEGERVLADILTRGGVLSTSVVAGDPQMTGFNEGKRALALEIVEQLRWNPMDLVALAEQRADGNLRQMDEAA